jgi:transcriptional regulator with GAF, ATPase, and Fis domain
VERFLPLLLEVWKEACRHIQIDESVTRITPVLVRRLPLDHLLIRRFDNARSCLDTVARGDRGGDGPPLAGRSSCSAEELQRLLVWAASRQVARGEAATVRTALPGLLPEGLAGPILAGGLIGSEGPVGVAVLGAQPPRRFDLEHEQMLQALLDPLAVAVENDWRLRELAALREAAEADRRSLLTRLGRQDIVDTIVGAEGGLRGVMERVELVARADAPVLILGETGTGKEVVARAIHARSPRASGPFLRVNCGAIPSELIDSELFGHERGSFTGASAQRKGWFERADGGTLFMDEVGELSPAAQVRLLRILQDGSFERVGGQHQLTVDVRVVAATNRDLQAMVAEGSFRQDLWYRIAVFPVYLPALRERVDDIPALATHFALRAAARLGLPPQVPNREDTALLAAYSWPGNVRELASVMERAAILGDGRRLEVAAALGVTAPPQAVGPGPLRPPAAGGPPAEAEALATLDAAMARHIERALARCHGRVEGRFGAARVLGINPHTLRARMRKLGVEWQRFRDAP